VPALTLHVLINAGALEELTKQSWKKMKLNCGWYKSIYTRWLAP